MSAKHEGVNVHCMFAGDQIATIQDGRCPLCDVAADDPGFAESHELVPPPGHAPDGVDAYAAFVAACDNSPDLDRLL